MRRLRLLTYNTHLMEGSNIVVGAAFAGKMPVLFRDEERYAFIVERLKASGADIVALQEVWSARNMERLMAEVRSSYPYSAHGDSGPWHQAGSGLVFLSRYPLSEVEFFTFPGATDLEEMMASKGVLRATVELPDGGGRISVGVTHCWTDAGGDNCTNIRDLIARTVTDTQPAILMGDFNIHRHGDPAKFSRLSAWMQSCNAVDTWTSAHGTAWTEAAATDDQAHNTLSQFFSPDRDTPDPDCIDYVFVRGMAEKKFLPLRAEVLRHWRYLTGASTPAWYWVHVGTVGSLPTACVLGDRLCVVTRDTEGSLRSAIYDRATRRWRHDVLRDTSGTTLQADAAPSLVCLDSRLQLFFTRGRQVYKTGSSDGAHWSSPQSQGPALQTSGGVQVASYRGVLHAFVRDPHGDAVCMQTWSGGWSERKTVGLSTAGDISAAVLGDTLCVVAQEGAASSASGGRVRRALLTAAGGWDVGPVGDARSAGSAGLAVHGGRFEVYCREPAQPGEEPGAGGHIVRFTSADGKNWDAAGRLDLRTADVVYPISFDGATWLFFPFPHRPIERMLYPHRALAHAYYPPGVDLDASDHYPYLVELAWPD